jgi:hypothetical protein
MDGTIIKILKYFYSREKVKVSVQEEISKVYMNTNNHLIKRTIKILSNFSVKNIKLIIKLQT